MLQAHATSAGIVSGDVYTIANACSSQLLTVNAGTSSYTNVIRTFQSPANGQNSQKWMVSSANGGEYILQPLISMEYLNVANDDADQGESIIEWPAPVASNDYFKIIAAGNGYYKMIGNNSGLAVGLSSCTSTSGTYVNQYTDSGASQQQWLFTDMSQPLNPTATPTQFPTAIPTTATTAIPTAAPTATPVPGDTILNFTLGLAGVGDGGTTTAVDMQGNTNPLHPTRQITVQLYNSQNQLVESPTGTVNYDSDNGLFTGSIDLGNQFVTGVYTVKLQTPQYLRELVPGIQTITAGQTITLPEVDFVVGDINGDNQINALDYNILMGCYSDLLPATDCNESNNILSDLNDDGNVNAIDYNLFLRELTNLGGQ